MVAGESPAYNATVLARFSAPRFAGVLRGADVVCGRAGSVAAGREVAFSLRWGPDGAALRFQAYGCPHTIAAADLAAERLTGADRETLAAFRGLSLVEALALPADKLAVVLVVEDALKAALAKI